MVSSKIIFSLLLMSSSLYGMYRGDEEGLEMKPLNSPECKSVIIDIHPRHSQLIDTALQEEKRIISESETFDQMRAKINALLDDNIRKKVADFIDSDIYELHTAVQESDSDTVEDLLRKHLADRIKFPHQLPLFDVPNAEECNFTSEPSLSAEFLSHVEQQLDTKNSQAKHELAINFNRMKLYCDYLKPLAQYETRITDFTHKFIAASALLYTPLQLITHSNMWLFALTSYAGIGHMYATYFIEKNYDVSHNQESHYILNVLNKTDSFSKKVLEQLQIKE